MGTLALAMASSHAPGLTGWLEKAPPESQEAVRDGFSELERRIDQANLDVLIMIANDHLANARLGAYPDFTVAMRDQHEGPDDWFKDWLKVPNYAIPGAPDVADHVLLNMTARGFPMYATWQNLRYDDNISVPTAMTNLTEKNLPVVPILQNCTVPPIPDENRCYEFGVALRETIEALPGDMRVGVYGTGGMAHEPGGPRYFVIDDEFDRRFMELLAEGDHGRLRKEATLEAMEEAGSGGTAELLTWIIVAAAAGEAACTPLFYDPIKTMRCGIGAATWQIEAPQEVSV